MVLREYRNIVEIFVSKLVLYSFLLKVGGGGCCNPSTFVFSFKAFAFDTLKANLQFTRKRYKTVVKVFIQGVIPEIRGGEWFKVNFCVRVCGYSMTKYK